jgi:glycosyltransferase involved in cell wall biosynthesis
MPKVLIVIARLNVGGTAQYIAELARGLKGSKYELLIATGHVQGAEVEDLVTKELPIARIASMGRKVSLFADIRARGELKRVINQYQPNLIYSHTFKAGLLSRSIKNGIPKIHAFHGHLLSEPELRGFKSKIVIFVERVLAKRSKALVTVGERVAQQLLEKKVGQSTQYRSIAPGVRELALEERGRARRFLGIEKEERPIVVWMARVTSVKAPQRVAQVAREITEAFFVLAGGGDLLEGIKRDVPSNMKVVGWQKASRIWAVADLAISTSENEGMPVALIEAQLSGIPVVALNVGSVAEVVVDKRSGFCPHSFDEAFTSAVRKLVLDKALRMEFGEFATQNSTARFSIEVMAMKHRELFEEILRDC